MNGVQFTTHVRTLLGRGYSVAVEEGGIDDTLRLVVLRRGAEELLIVETSHEWTVPMSLPPKVEDGVLLKHMAIYIKRFFAHPDSLPERSFDWPGTPRSRTRVRLALDSRTWRRVSVHAWEGDAK